MNDYCKLYIQTTNNIDWLMNFIEINMNLKKESPYSLYNDIINIDIEENEEYSQIECKEFPDGFLFFKFYLDINIQQNTDFKDYICLITKLLSILWNNNVSSVASCDFEDQLLNNGGYNNKNVPWN